MPTVLHIDGLSTEPVDFISIEPGTSLRELVEDWGGTIRTEYVPDPTPLQKTAKRAQEVGAEVSTLLRECKTWGDVPAPRWDHEPGSCVMCDARRIVEGMLD